MARKLCFFKISKLVNFQIFIFLRLSNTNYIYYCFLLDFTYILVPATEWLENCDFLKFQNWLIFNFSYF